MWNRLSSFFSHYYLAMLYLWLGLPLNKIYLCQMKLLALLFAIFMLTASCLPCACTDDCVVSATEHKGPTDEKQDDPCTAFCICDCCMIVVDTHGTSLSYELRSNKPGKEKFHFHPQQFISYSCHSIWQPPRIG